MLHPRHWKHRAWERRMDLDRWLAGKLYALADWLMDLR